MSQALKNQIIKVSQELGFADIKFIPAKALLDSEKHFLEWRDKGFAADMNYLLKDDPINARPEHLLTEAKTIIMFTAHYYNPAPLRPSLEHGRIASYAVGLDYHKVLRKKIQDLINHPELKDSFSKSKFFTDAVPLLEKSFAKKAGLGFRGKNTLLISRESGSFNFILEIITDLELEPDTNPNGIATDGKRNDITCGNCVRCIDICPTNALPKPYQLDARKCISYHTIENRGEVPDELASKFGEWFFGCDLCQTVCPYNRDAKVAKAKPPIFPEFNPDAGFGHWIYLPNILDLEYGKHQNSSSLISALESHKFIRKEDFKLIKNKLEKKDLLEDEDLDFVFQTKFAQTPLLRPKRSGLIRNAKIVLQNSI